MCENADKYRGFQIFETLLVVLNVDGSSPSGHPPEKVLQVNILQDLIYLMVIHTASPLSFASTIFCFRR